MGNAQHETGALLFCEAIESGLENHILNGNTLSEPIESKCSS